MVVNLLLKFGKKERMESFLEKGEVYFNKPSEFRKSKENERGDPLEGAESIQNGGFTKIEYEHPELGKGELPLSNDSGRLIQSNDYFLSYSLYEISESFFESEEPIKVNGRMREFGDFGVLVHNPKKFMEKIESELKRLNIGYEYGVVEYLDLDKLGKHDPTPFIKNESFSHQREFRIIIPNEKDVGRLISIGCIKDLCHKPNTEYIIGSKELTEMRWNAKRIKAPSQ